MALVILVGSELSEKGDPDIEHDALVGRPPVRLAHNITPEATSLHDPGPGAIGAVKSTKENFLYKYLYADSLSINKMLCPSYLQNFQSAYKIHQYHSQYMCTHQRGTPHHFRRV